MYSQSFHVWNRGNALHQFRQGPVTCDQGVAATENDLVNLRVGGDVIQCFLVQVICIQEDLQAGELLGE